jgi:hypothetical protein
VKEKEKRDWLFMEYCNLLKEFPDLKYSDLVFKDIEERWALFLDYQKDMKNIENEFI